MSLCHALRWVFFEAYQLIVLAENRRRWRKRSPLLSTTLEEEVGATLDNCYSPTDEYNCGW